MLIDVVFFVLMALAFYKGFTKGFVMAIFSVLGFIIGLAAALKLSSTVSTQIQQYTNAGKWLPALSFLLVFIAVAFAIHFVGKIIQKSIETVLLGWANRLAGFLLYALLYSLIYSVFLFFAVQLHFLKTDVTQASTVYPYLQPLAPKVINAIGEIIPWFKNMFTELQNFFGKYAAANKTV